jgi:peptidoglycan/LPS O-acetylase OafA/YrhL
MAKDGRIDTLRGFACLLLVLYHVVGSDPSNGLRVDGGPVRWLNDGLAYVRMPLFTVLSGLVYGLRPFEGDSARFLGGKARRLIVPMLVVGTLFALLQASVPNTNSAIQDWRLLHIEPLGHFWFVESLFWVFVLVWALERLRAIDSPRGFAATCLLAAGVYLTVRGPHWFGIEGAIYLLPYFLAGLAVSRFSLWARLTDGRARGLLLVAAAVAVFQIGMPEPNHDRRTVWILLAGLSLCGLCLSVGFGLRAPPAWLQRVGRGSYAIYLFHVFFTAAARIATTEAGLAWLPLQIATGLALGIAGPMLIERWASRERWLRLLLLGQSTGRSRRAVLDASPQA